MRNSGKRFSQMIHLKKHLLKVSLRTRLHAEDGQSTGHIRYFALEVCEHLNVRVDASAAVTPLLLSCFQALVL